MIDSQHNKGNGRDSSGRFALGNKGGPGNPFARKVGQLRAALLETVTEDDMRAVAAKLVQMARGGNLPAMRELLERMLGKPVEADFMERLEELEKHLTQAQERDLR
jgi:hypothetical protein